MKQFFLEDEIFGAAVRASLRFPMACGLGPKQSADWSAHWNAFVPNNGESLNDMVPPPYVTFFEQIAAQRGDSSLVLPFPIWREAFINDVDLASAQKATTFSIRIQRRHSLTRFR